MPGDSLPHLTTEPSWARTALLGGETVTIDPFITGSIRLTAGAGGSQRFERRDSVGPSTDAYMEARLQVNGALSRPEVSFGIYDGTRFIGVGLSDTRVGFVANGFNATGNSVASATTGMQSYRIRKFGQDSVQLLINGARVLSKPYSDFALTRPVSYSLFEFGNPGLANGSASQSGNSSTWDYVIYEIGATQP